MQSEPESVCPRNNRWRFRSLLWKHNNVFDKTFLLNVSNLFTSAISFAAERVRESKFKKHPGTVSKREFKSMPFGKVISNAWTFWCVWLFSLQQSEGEDISSGISWSFMNIWWAQPARAYCSREVSEFVCSNAALNHKPGNRQPPPQSTHPSRLPNLAHFPANHTSGNATLKSFHLNLIMWFNPTSWR